MTLQLAAVATAIGALSVAGLDIRDDNEIPAEVGQRGSPLLIPLPNIITDFSMERDSFGGGSTAKMTCQYTMNYRLLFEPAGTNRRMTLATYNDLVVMIGKILDAVLVIDVFIAAHTEVVDIVPVSVTNMGLVNDPSDNTFFGCDFAFQVSEFVN